MRSLSLLIPIFLCALVGSAEAAKQITVLTTTSDGVPVRAIIKIKIFPSGEKEAFIQRERNGVSIISVEQCDEFVSLNATSDVIGITRKINDDVPDWLPCEEPEVVFNDFQIQRFVFSARNPTYGDADFWRNTLGAEATASRPELPETLAAAFRNQEYGKISIITTEIQQALRAAGKSQDADFLYSLAVDASANGILTAKGKNELIDDALRYSPRTNRFELTNDAQAVVKAYQTEALRLPRNSETLGQIDWRTMKSLQGGAEVNIPNVELSVRAMRSFEVDRKLYRSPL